MSIGAKVVTFVVAFVALIALMGLFGWIAIYEVLFAIAVAAALTWIVARGRDAHARRSRA